MTESELIQEIKDDLSHSCSLPYNLKDPEIKRIIKRARGWFFDNYQYAVEDRIFVMDNSLFNHPEFRKTRHIALPANIVTVYDVREVNGVGITGTPDKDFGDSKLLGSELLMSPFVGDNLVYRTVMYSYFDLAKAYLLETFAFKWNKNSKKLTILGRDPNRSGMGGSQGSASNKGTFDVGGVSIAVKCFVAINDDELYDDELFVRYCIAKAKIQLARILGTFSFNLPGNISINYDMIASEGKEELDAIIEEIKGDQGVDFFLTG